MMKMRITVLSGDWEENIRKYEKCTKFGFTRASVSSWKRPLVCKGT